LIKAAWIQSNILWEEVKRIEVDLLDYLCSWRNMHSCLLFPPVSSGFCFLLAIPREYLYQAFRCPFIRRGSGDIRRVHNFKELEISAVLIGFNNVINFTACVDFPSS